MREIAQNVIMDSGPRYNIAPSQQIVTVTEGEHGRVLDEYKGGLIKFCLGSALRAIPGVEVKLCRRRTIRSIRSPSH